MPHNYYPKCELIKRPIKEDKVTPEVASAISLNYRTLPVFEKGLYEYNSKKYYSIQTNEYLKCRWAEYKAGYVDRVFSPVHIYNVGDYHFYKYLNRLAPLESITKRLDHRRKLMPGPGVDSRGQIPIPNELIMKRGSTKAESRKKKEEKKNSDGTTKQNF